MKVMPRGRGHGREGTENWRLIVEAAGALTAAGRSPFTRISVYGWIWRRYPRSEHDRPSLDPTFQGMIGNAPGGPDSSAGTPLARVAAAGTSWRGRSAQPGARAPGTRRGRRSRRRRERCR